MQFRWTLAALTLAAAAVSGPAQAADPVADLIVLAGDTAHQTVVDAQNRAERTLDSAVVVNPPAGPKQVRALGSADDITIKDMGSGPVITFGGVLTTLWDCTKSTNIGAPVSATCTPKANTNIDWTCGFMGVTAVAHSRVIDYYDHAVEVLRDGTTARQADAGPSVPDPRPRQWGQVSGRVACDGQQIETAQADRNNPVAEAATTMGSVTAFTCTANRSPGTSLAPVPQYTVVCVDPVNPTTLG